MRLNLLGLGLAYAFGVGTVLLVQSNSSPPPVCEVPNGTQTTIVGLGSPGCLDECAVSPVSTGEGSDGFLAPTQTFAAPWGVRVEKNAEFDGFRVQTHTISAPCAVTVENQTEFAGFRVTSLGNSRFAYSSEPPMFSSSPASFPVPTTMSDAVIHQNGSTVPLLGSNPWLFDLIDDRPNKEPEPRGLDLEDLDPDLDVSEPASPILE